MRAYSPPPAELIRTQRLSSAALLTTEFARSNASHLNASRGPEDTKDGHLPFSLYFDVWTSQAPPLLCCRRRLVQCYTSTLQCAIHRSVVPLSYGWINNQPSPNKKVLFYWTQSCSTTTETQALIQNVQTHNTPQKNVYHIALTYPKCMMFSNYSSS